MKKTLTIILLLFVLFYTRSQNQTYAVETIAFYNVENLFDHYDDPKTRDDDRTPEGRDRWTEDIFEKKLTNTAIVIADLAREITGGPPAVIGLSEVENRYVVERLIETPELKNIIMGLPILSPLTKGVLTSAYYTEKVSLPFYELKHISFHFLILMVIVTTHVISWLCRVCLTASSFI